MHRAGSQKRKQTTHTMVSLLLSFINARGQNYSIDREFHRIEGITSKQQQKDGIVNKNE